MRYNIRSAPWILCMILSLLLACNPSDAEYKGWDDTTISLSESDYYFGGIELGEQTGYAVSGAGDVDGDDKNDFLIAADHNHVWGYASGKVFLITADSLEKERRRSLLDADYIFTAETDEDLLGHGMSAAGDVNNDGLDDFWISAYIDHKPHVENGSVYLISGSSLGEEQNVDLSTMSIQYHGETELDRLGHSVSADGDVDGDGLNDLLIGSYGNNNNTGKVYLIYAASMTEGEQEISVADVHFYGENEGDKTGYSLSIVGDVDGDGYQDLHIGAKESNEAFNKAGKTYIVSGASVLSAQGSLELIDAEYQFLGSSEQEICCTIPRTGDIDGDSKDDLLMGSQFNIDGASGTGVAYIVLSSSLGNSGTRSLIEADHIFSGEADGDMLGSSVTSIGDIDNDGLVEIIVSSFHNSPSNAFVGGGTSYLFFGHQFSSLPQNLSVLDATHRFEGTREKEGSGRGLTNIGDVNGDSLNDILIGAPMEYNDRYEYSGGAYLFLTPGR
jgi:hypothetical protein